MTWEMATLTEPKARKDYHCEASDWIDNSGLGEEDFGIKDWAVIENARAENWQIRKGTTYVNTKGKWDGDFTVFRARTDLNAICRKHNIYQDI